LESLADWPQVSQAPDSPEKKRAPRIGRVDGERGGCRLRESLLPAAFALLPVPQSRPWLRFPPPLIEPRIGATPWHQQLASLEANKDDFPQLDAYRTQLAAMLTGVREASKEQAAMAASKQEASQRLKTLIADGRKLATFLRGGIRQQYGNRSEKLVEFDLQPLRTRTRVATAGAGTKPPTVTPPAPVTPGTPATPADTKP
jgi:hypothetical protein